MLHGGSGTTAEDLDAIEREVAACREALRDLESRARVMEVESKAWKRPSVRLARPDMGAYFGFFAGVFGMAMLGIAVAHMIGR